MGHQQFLRGVSVYIVDILLFLLVVAKKNKGCFLVKWSFQKNSYSKLYFHQTHYKSAYFGAWGRSPAIVEFLS